MNSHISKTTHSIGSTPTGNMIHIDSYTISKGAKGPKLYIQGGVHGGEITIWIIKALIEQIKEIDLKGEITFVPIANPSAWSQRTYFSTNGKFDMYMGKDWNRNYPGDKSKSLAERTTAISFDLAKDADFVLDLHTSRNSIPFTIYSEENLEYIKALGLKYNYLDNNKDGKSDGAFTDELARIGTACFTLECGSHDSYDKQIVEDIVARILNLMQFIGSIPGNTPSNKVEQFSFTCTKKYYAPQGGFIKHNYASGMNIKKSDTLGNLYLTDLSKKIIDIDAEANEVLLKVSPTHIYWPGDEVYQTIRAEDLTII